MQAQEILTSLFHLLSIGVTLILSYNFITGLKTKVPATRTAIARASNNTPPPAAIAQSITTTEPTAAIAQPITTTETQTEIAVAAKETVNETNFFISDPWNEPATKPATPKTPKWAWMGNIQEINPDILPKAATSTLKALPSSTMKKRENKFQNLPIRELKKLASKAKITGYSKLSKAELIVALSA